MSGLALTHAPNYWKLHRARQLQALIIGSMTTACIIPPALEEQTGPANHPPRISSTAPTAEQPYASFLGQPMTITLGIEDQDLDDYLFLRVFIDYDPSTSSVPVVDKLIPPNRMLLRTTSFEVRPCPSAGRPIALAVLTDRVFLSEADGGLPYRRLSEGAESDDTFWPISCVEAPTDGGI